MSSATFSICKRSTLSDSWVPNGDMHASRLCLITIEVISENLEGIRAMNKDTKPVFPTFTTFDHVATQQAYDSYKPIIIILQDRKDAVSKVSKHLFV